MDLQTLLEETIRKENSRVQNEIKIIQEKLDGFMKNAFALEPKLASISEALAKQGLEVSSAYFTENGAEISAIPVAGSKFKFCTFKGYNARGETLNISAIDKKAEKMAESIKQHSGVSCVVVNKYSLELRQNSGTRRVLINIKG